MRALATLALLHEVADDAWKAAVERGRTAGPQGMSGGPDSFLNGLAALIAEERDRLKEEWARGPTAAEGADAVAGELAELRFEVGAMRGRLEAIERLLEGVRTRLDGMAAGTATGETGRRG